VPIHPSGAVANITSAPKKKKKWKEIEARKPSVTFKDFGGSSKVIQVGVLYAQRPKGQQSVNLNVPLTLTRIVQIETASRFMEPYHDVVSRTLNMSDLIFKNFCKFSK
jgi:hypothetical protein